MGCLIIGQLFLRKNIIKSTLWTFSLINKGHIVFYPFTVELNVAVVSIISHVSHLTLKRKNSINRPCCYEVPTSQTPPDSFTYQ